MLIHEVCQKCSLTKKAVEYYERQGLLHPEVGDSGYRNYRDEEVSRLKEIAVLRKLGLGVSEIKVVLASENKPLTLSKYEYLTDLKKQRISEQQKGIEQLIRNYNIDKAMEEIQAGLDRMLALKEKLALSFPGSYGTFLSIHFGRFLDGKADTAEQEKAYAEIVDFLDNLKIPDELERDLEHISLMRTEDIDHITGTLHNAVENPEGYMTDNRKNMEEYMKFLSSDAFKTTPAYKLRQALSEFQKSSGYEEVLIANMKMLSPSYRAYAEKLQKANELWMEKTKERGPA